MKSRQTLTIHYLIIILLSAEFVTVGWGKKETQFHGSEGKHAATKKEELAQHGVRTTDDMKPRIR